jgi:nucleoside phosphorylase
MMTAWETRGVRFRPTLLVLAVALTMVLGSEAVAKKKKAPPLCATVSSRKHAPVLAILSAFPAELVPLVAATTVEETIQIGAKSFYRGRMGGVHVVLGLLGIGLVNADTTIQAVLDGVRPAGVIVSGVAGSTERIGDVVIVDDWTQAGIDGVTAVNSAMRALAERAASSLPALETCALVPPGSATGTQVCMPFEPGLVIGGHGFSSDPYNGAAPCIPNNHTDILGCDLPPASLVLGVEAGTPEIQDMETAAVARRTLERNVPFVGVRAVSDGAGDPKGDRGNFQQFFDYYVLAADNAAAVTRTVVAELASVAKDKKQKRTCRFLAKRQWDKAAAQLAPQPPH